MPVVAQLFARQAVACGAALGLGATGCGSADLFPIRPPLAQDGAGLDGGPVAADAGTARSCKRGIATNAGPSAALASSVSSPGVAWWYNWDTQSPGGDPRVEYVPMLWGGGSLDRTLPATARYVLGFNDPDLKTQSDLAPEQAAADWPAVEAKARAAGIPLVSPSVGDCGSAGDASPCAVPAITDAYTYLKDFFAACSGCQVDYVGVHASMCDVSSLQAYLEGNVETGGALEGFTQFGRPLWVTELGCDATHSAADQQAYMEAAVPYLESNPDVVRYAWFSAMPIPSAQLTNADGSLTALGSTYVSLPESCR
jgi:hypothetical protein